MAVHNAKRLIKTIIRKIGDYEQSTLRLLFMRFEVQSMNDFPVIGYPCFAHRILGSPGGNIVSRYKEMYGVDLFLP